MSVVAYIQLNKNKKFVFISNIIISTVREFRKMSLYLLEKIECYLLVERQSSFQ